MRAEDKRRRMSRVIRMARRSFLNAMLSPMRGALL